MSQGLTSSESIVPAVVFILMFVVCGYLLIYNIFDISVMQDVRQVRSAADDWNFHTADQEHCEPSGGLAHADRTGLLV